MRRLRSSASAMVWPVTNCSPIIRMAMSMPRRITGSPPRAISRVSAEDSAASLPLPVSRPVTSSPQVAALTNGDGLWPRWARQSPGAILSRIKRVAGGGVGDAQQRLGQAHERHALLAGQGVLLHQGIDAAALRLGPQAPPPGGRPAPAPRRRAAAAGWRRSSSGGRQSGSGRRHIAVMASRSGVCARTPAAKAANGAVDVGSR